MNGRSPIGLQKEMGTTLMWFGLAFLMLLSVLIVLALAAMLMMGSQFGLLLVIIVSVIQLVIFIRYMAHNELKNVLADFKGE